MRATRRLATCECWTSNGPPADRLWRMSSQFVAVAIGRPGCSTARHSDGQRTWLADPMSGLVRSGCDRPPGAAGAPWGLARRPSAPPHLWPRATASVGSSGNCTVGAQLGRGGVDAAQPLGQRVGAFGLGAVGQEPAGLGCQPRSTSWPRSSRCSRRHPSPIPPCGLWRPTSLGRYLVELRTTAMVG
jgi:hypothetical protein